RFAIGGLLGSGRKSQEKCQQGGECPAAASLLLLIPRPLDVGRWRSVASIFFTLQTGILTASPCPPKQAVIRHVSSSWQWRLRLWDPPARDAWDSAHASRRALPRSPGSRRWQDRA